VTEVVVGEFPPCGWLVAGVCQKWDNEPGRLGNELCFTCSLERPGQRATQVARFTNAKLVKWTAEPVASAWQVKLAYCQVVEIKESTWIKHIQDRHPSYSRVHLLKHYLMYIEDDGAYEIAAENAVLDDVEVTADAVRKVAMREMGE